MRARPTGVLLLTTLLLSGCGTVQEPAATDLADPTPESATATVTQTAETTATATAAGTETVTGTSTAISTASATARATETETWTEAATAVKTGTASSPTPDLVWPTGDASTFDEPGADLCAARIVEDVTTVDGRVLSGSDLPDALLSLSESYTCLSEAGTPPGVGAAEYQSQLRALSLFTEETAAGDHGNPQAAYVHIRAQTAPVLELLNGATGWSYALPETERR